LSNASLQAPQPSQDSPIESLNKSPVDIVVAGTLAVDISCDFAPLSTSTDQVNPAPHTSNPAIINQTLGGVAHNIAKAAHFLGSSVRLCSAIGDDLSGQAALNQLEAQGMRTDGIRTLPSPNKTAQYVAINNAHKDLTLAMADMSILESSTPASIKETWLSSPTLPTTSPPKCLIVDANWTPSCLHTWLRHGKSLHAKTIFEPVSTAKSTRLFITPKSSSNKEDTDTNPVFPHHVVDLATPNTHELTALHNRAYALDLFTTRYWFRVIDALGIPSTGLRVPLSYTTTPSIVDAGIPQQAIKLLPFIPTLLTKLGPGGVLMTKLLRADDPLLSDADEAKYVLARNGNADTELGVGGLYVRLFAPEEVLAPEEVVSVNGIGDTFLGALAAALVQGGRVQDVVGLAQRAAGLSLRSKESVSPELRGLRGDVEALSRKI
jgi:pseudouridine-5'-phosphate glycosidase/pseudouridine kinase